MGGAGTAMHREGVRASRCRVLHFSVDGGQLIEHAFFVESGFDQFLTGDGHSSGLIAVLQQFDDAVSESATVRRRHD